jgi:hypothetical protein
MMDTFSIPSSKPQDPPYTVTLGGPEGDTCECKAFHFCTDEVPTCKHIKQARAITESDDEA